MIAGGIAAGLLLVAGLDARLTVRHYTVESEKVEQAVRLAVLTDLHSCKYGQNQQGLLDAVADQDPDLVLLCGDIVDDELWKEEWRALLTVKKLAEQCPVYYASGNHEYRTGRLEEIKELLRACGAVVLDGYSVCAAAGEQMIQIGGVDDPKVGELRWEEQLAAASGDLDGKHFSILLTHRPERVDDYAGSGFDLVLAGHQALFGINVCSIIAWMKERRGRDAHMHFPGAGIPEQRYDASDRISPDDGIVH